MRLRDLESQMDTLFAGSFHDFGDLFGRSRLASSVDLREQKDKYVARVYVPNGDTSNLKAKVENGDLHVTMQTAQKAGGATGTQRYDQIISLPQPIKADQMKIDRKQNLVVITIPKANAAVAAASPAVSPMEPEAPGAGPETSPATWDERLANEMERMETQMDQVFKNAFPNDLLNGTSTLRLGSTMNIEDQDNNYVVHFTLPDTKMSDVQVNFENGQLHLVAREQKSNTMASPSPGTIESMEKGRYEEMITLPGPVKESEMKVGRKGSTVVVTLPKA